ncbi:MAG: tetratricopeptide repeat protein [Cyclobacteriaceae bacterium]|nr:tetratricopeptide repeat protein [Cyclobacteriaceae bacterium]
MRKLFFAAVFITSHAAYTQPVLPDPETAFALAQKKMRERKFQEAQQDLTQLINAGHLHPDYFIKRGICYYQLNDNVRAISDFNAAETAGLTTLELHEYRGLALYHRHELEKAANDLGQAVQIGTRNYECLFYLGQLKSEQREFTEAIALYNRAIPLARSNPATYIARGKAYLEQDKYKEAISDFSFAIRLDPNTAEGYENRALAYFRSSQYEAATSDFQIIESMLDAPDTDILKTLSDLYFNTGKYDKAIDYYSKLIEAEPTSGKWYYKRGRCHLERNNFQAALRDFNVAQSAGFDDVALNLDKARAFVYLKDQKAALLELDKVLEKDKRNTKAYYNRAVIKEEQKDYEGAWFDYSRVILLDPNDAMAFYNRANCKAGMNDFGAGITDLDEAIRLDPKNASFYKQRGNLYYRMEEKDKACFDWRKAAEFGDAKARFQVEEYCKKK